MKGARLIHTSKKARCDQTQAIPPSIFLCAVGAGEEEDIFQLHSLLQPFSQTSKLGGKLLTQQFAIIKYPRGTKKKKQGEAA